MESWITLTGISDKKTEFKNVMFTLKEDGLIDINQNLDHKFKKVLSNF